MKPVLYTTYCPKCKVLEYKLKEKKVDYEVEDNVDNLIALGLSSAPVLMVEDGRLLNFKQGIDWVNSLEG